MTCVSGFTTLQVCPLVVPRRSTGPIFIYAFDATVDPLTKQITAQTPSDLTGAVGYFRVVDICGNDIIPQVSGPPAITIDADPLLGKAELALSLSDTDHPPGTYFYDAWFVHLDGRIQPVVQKSPFIIIPTVVVVP